MKTRHVIFFVGVLALLCLAAFLRFAWLDFRPLHGDEANQAIKTVQLFDDFEYRYDPHEHHGPTLYFFALPWLHAMGISEGVDATESLLRSIPAAAAVLTVAATLLFYPALGKVSLLWALLFMAISHGLVFYARYYIQESLLVLFCVLAVAGFYRYLRSGRLGWALLLGVSIGLMHATKETFVIPLFALALAATTTLAFMVYRGHTKLHPGVSQPQSRRVYSIPLPHVLAAMGSGVLVSGLFYSSFLTNPSGILDSLATFQVYIERAEGTGSTAIHDKPWHYYLQLLAFSYREAGPRWSEGLLLFLAGLGALIGLWKLFRYAPPSLTREQITDHYFFPFLVLYTLIITAVFSLIPYKTPWNLLPFLHPMAILAGVGAGELMRILWRGKPGALVVAVALGAVFLLFASMSLRQTWQGIFLYSADTRNPYVYAHTSTALMRLVRQLEELASLHPEGRNMRVDIVKPDGDYWPLPWYLRHFGRVGYWPALPTRMEAAVLLTDSATAPQIAEQLEHDAYHAGFSALRPGVNLVYFVETSLWQALLEKRSASTAETSPHQL